MFAIKTVSDVKFLPDGAKRRTEQQWTTKKCEWTTNDCVSNVIRKTFKLSDMCTGITYNKLSNKQVNERLSVLD